MTTANEAPGGGLPGEGDVIAGKYRVERVLGRGGMGVVVAAQHVTLRQKVAIKFLLPGVMSRHGAPERFLREAQSAAAIQSEHVARVIDVSTLPTGVPFMVMEYLTGTDLGHVLEERKFLPVEEAIDYLLQACEAIAEAHALGIIHRDLKPENLFLTSRADGSSLVKVLDFGLSKAIRPDAPGALELSLTATNNMLGSPHYMSPEQVRNLKSIDSRTDLWALGVILYQLLTGHRPFEEESLGGLFVMIGSDAPTPIHTWRSDLPAGLSDVIIRCLEKEPTARTQSVAELARGLEPFGSVETRVSVERIMRVLADRAPLPPPRASQSSYPDAYKGSLAAPLPPASPSQPPAGSRLSSRPAPPSSAAPLARGGIDSTMALASTLAQGEVGLPDRLNTERALPRPSSAVPVAVGAAIGVVVLGMVMLFVFRSAVAPGPSDRALGAPPPSASASASASAVASASAAPRQGAASKPAR